MLACNVRACLNLPAKMNRGKYSVVRECNRASGCLTGERNRENVVCINTLYRSSKKGDGGNALCSRIVF